MMKIRILGGGWYGCHIALALARDGLEVELHETEGGIFRGASGSIPARLHQGFHYPRSRLTRAACLHHAEEFMRRYGDLTQGVPINIYAIAQDRSLIDFQQYVRTLEREVHFVPIHRPAEFGLLQVEGALLTGERHILTHKSRGYFEKALEGRIVCNSKPASDLNDSAWDWTIDCTFCANESAGVDRYEPCLVVLLEGPTDRAITIMDGPFPSLYPWDEREGLSSLSSAQWTPFSKSLKSWGEARQMLDNLGKAEIMERGESMISQMAEFYPAIREYKPAAYLLSVRAMPLSGADTRLVDVARLGDRLLRVRAGKIDAVIEAERQIKAMIAC